MTDTITLPRAVIEQAVKALAECYDVESYPSDGSTQQDAALNELRAALAQQAEQGWQPIESAPEGAMILCANMKATDARSWAYVAWIAGGKICGHRMDMPTHWMPLPDSPKEKN